MPEGSPSAPRESTVCLLCGAPAGEPLFESEVQLAPATGERFHFIWCPDCRLVYLSPRIPEPGLGVYYPPDYLPYRPPEAWGRWAFLVRGSQRRLDRARVRAIRRHGAPGPRGRVLDVGCGRPSFLEELHRRTGATCVGLDFSDAGWRDDPTGWTGLTLIEGTLESKRREVEAAGPYDVITLWHALEHDYRPVETLRALRAMAAPGAILVVEVPNLDSLSARRHGSGWAGFHTPRHTAAYDPRTLAATLEAGGWSVERSVPFGTLDPAVLWWLGRRIRRGDPVTGDLESRFAEFLVLKAALLPLSLLQRWVSLGIQTAIAHADPVGPGPRPDAAIPSPG